ncbi:MAG: HemK family protein methyltransferase, partial [Candidatus Helarchaeota archaeon]|nr:HemK family protein methyltransferase [Candidatus Helarchaeota archaeon]
EGNVFNILDIGTGCGNIAVSLAKYIDNSKIFAIDISNEILKIAEENAKMNSVTDKITFKNLSIFDAGKTEFKDIRIIVSNPPYISIRDFPNLPDEVKLYEPEKGLCDNADGLSFFKVICEKSKNWLTPDGMLFVEVGLGESENVSNIMKSFGFSNIKILKDYQQIERIVFCENIN